MDKMVKEMVFSDFFRNKRVLITGHTGFKGSWLSMILNWLGAEVYGYALHPNTNPSLYCLSDLNRFVRSTIGDIRDYDKLLDALRKIRPEIIIHMAAQPLVIESYRNPRETYEVNVMGTVNLFEVARYIDSIRVILNVTTDKCYENKEWFWGYRENEMLGGFDPYSNSKACSELVTSAFRNSFFSASDYKQHGIAVATARAGNVIGGGDWAADRLIPDFFRSVSENITVEIRNPNSIRPWQHVFEPLYGYLLLCKNLYLSGIEFADSWNFGPDDSQARNVEWIIEQLCTLWGENTKYISLNPKSSRFHEANYLRLDCNKAKTLLDWYPVLGIDKTLEMIVDWYRQCRNKSDVYNICIDQIENYFSLRTNCSNN